MNEEEFSEKLKQLIQKITNLPDDQKKLLEPMVKESIQRNKEISENTARAQSKLNEIFSNLRILVKYLLFDLEATRRERDRFKQIIDKDKPKGFNGEM